VTNQQIADEALALWQSHRGDDQERMDRILRDFFADVREEERTAEFKRQMSCVHVEFPCVIFTPPSFSPSLDHCLSECSSHGS
jgi:hypothetical protein